MNSRRILTAVCLGTVLIVGLVTAATPGEGSSAKPGVTRVAPALFGEPFPAYTYTNLNTKGGGAAQIDLGQILGKKPVVFYYFIPKNQRAEKVFVELQALVREVGPEKVSLIGIAVPRAGLGVEVIQARAAALQVEAPILRDDQFRIGQLLNVRRVPHIALLDQAGNLRLTNGGSLLQDLEYKMTLGDGIRRLAESGKLGSYGALKDYSPAVEMIGKTAPDFKAPSIRNSVMKQWSGMYAKNGLSVLVFWSVDCPHCRKSLPLFNDWYKNNKDKATIITAARVTNAAMRTKTREFIELQGLQFETVEDQDRVVAELYKVTATPTIFVIGPDGKVDSLMHSQGDDFGVKIEAKRKQLIKP
jgi:peroxiredoxin